MSDIIVNSHDKFFSETFKQLEVARDFVRYYLPAEVVSLLDINTLQISKDSFIDSQLKEHFSDLLYQITLRDMARPLYVYLLFDHKSYVDPLVGLQLLDYQNRIWDLSLKQQQMARKEQPRGQKERLQLPPIFPIVLYHGEETWQVSTEFIALFGDLPVALQPYIPNYNYWLCDLSHYHDEDIKGYVILQIGLLLLKYIYRSELREQLPEIIQLLQQVQDRPTALGYLETILRYVSNGSKHLTETQLHETLQEVFNTKEGHAMSNVIDQWIEKWLLEGKIQGRLEGETIGWQKGRLEGEEKARQIAIKAIGQTLAIRFDTIITQYNEFLQPLDLATLEKLNELAFTVATRAEFEATLPVSK